MVPIGVGATTRPGLVHRTASRVFLPRRALLSFGLAAGAYAPDRGILRVTIRGNGRTLGQRTLDPRMAPFRHESLAFDGPGREGTLEVDLRLTDSAGRSLPQAVGGSAAVTDPTLFDRDGIRGVVLVSIDTLRRDHVGLYGYGRPTTPRLDALARQGVAFDDAVSVSSWTLPAHLSMLTSVEPAVHGGVDGHHGFNHGVPSLAQTLRRAGFTTHAITSHLYVSPAYGLDAGFDHFDYADERRATEVADRAVAALNGFGQRPFLLFLHFYDPHWPYAAPEAHREPFGAKAARGLGSRPSGNAAPADPAPLRDAYDAEIHYTDAQIGRVLDHLDRTGLSRHTLVVVTSDHGEEFGEHGGYEHLRTLYEEIIRIPLVLRAPRVTPRVERAQVSLLDVAPTVLDAIGLPPAPTHRGQSLLGPLGEGEAHGETDLGAFVGPRRTRKLFVRAGVDRGKLILTLDRRTGETLTEEWFDLARDPLEAKAAVPPTVEAEAWRDRLLARWREARRNAGAGSEVMLDDEERGRLQALGYLGR